MNLSIFCKGGPFLILATPGWKRSRAFSRLVLKLLSTGLLLLLTFSLVSCQSEDSNDSGDSEKAPSTTVSPGFTVSSASGNTSEDGTTATFSVKLNTQPTDDVTIGIDSSDDTEGTVDKASLTFTTDNWNATNHIVTVTGVDDPIEDGDQSYTITLSPAISNDTTYNGLDPEDVSVVNVDDESTGFTVSAISGNTTEAEGEATFAVRLNSQPTADVVINLSSSDETEGTVDKAILTFTSDNWDAEQTVTITGVDDTEEDGDQNYTIILGTASSDDSGYDGIDPADIAVINTDDDVPAILVGTISGNTTESGGIATFTVKLQTPPGADVTIAVDSSDDTEGTVDKASLTFTSDNWNVEQTVTVTGQDDDIADGDQGYTIQLGTASSTDEGYFDLDPADVSVINTDMGETIGFTVSAISGNTTEVSGTATFTVRLTSEPLADVTIDVDSSDDTEGTVDKASLTFTSADWNAEQTVTVTGVDDDEKDGDQNYTIILGTASSDDSEYEGIDPPDIAVINTDDESPAILVGTISGNTTESGGTAAFTVKLQTQPVADVTIDVDSSDDTEGTVDKASLTFTSADWNAEQTVTVIGQDDSSIDGDQIYTIILSPASSTDEGYNGLDPADVSVTNLDDDWKLSDTGQSKCYDASHTEISCLVSGESYYGQDAHYASNLPSFTDNLDYTVTDNNTGLMWQQCSVGQVGGSGCDGLPDEYTWYEASGTEHATYNPDGATDVCASASTGEYNDWRLPNIEELESIIDSGTYSPSINEEYFPDVPLFSTTDNLSYWSSTTRADHQDNMAWWVFFDQGDVVATNMDGRFYVRCVRGGK